MRNKGKEYILKRAGAAGSLFLTLVLAAAIILSIAKVTYATDEYSNDEHIHENVEYTAWKHSKQLPAIPGNYYLTEDVTLSSKWRVPEGSTNICLNGHGIKLNEGQSEVIYIQNGASFTLHDCNGTQMRHFYKKDPAGLARVDDSDPDGAEMFDGGYITGGKGYTISGKTYGGGVFNNKGIFVIEGGTIIGNTATYGGGIENYTNGTTTVKGGAIFGNLAECGGGIDNFKGTIEISKNASITNNTADEGGGIYNSAGTFSLSGSPTISNNTKGNVCLYRSKIRIDGSLNNSKTISLKKINIDSERIEYSSDGTFAVPGENYTIKDSDADRFAAEDDDYYVTAADEDGSKVLVLKGKTVSRPVFSPAGGTFDSAQTVTVSSSTKGATIYYTTDGSMPDTNSKKYTGEITVSSSCTVKAIAVKDRMTDSELSSAEFRIEAPKSNSDVTPTEAAITVNTRTISAKAVNNAIARAGVSSDTVTTIILGKRVKKIKKGAFRNLRNVRTLEVRTKKLKKSSVKKSLKGSKIETVKVKVGKKKTNRKYTRKYRKIFTKKNAGKKVKVSRYY